MAMLTCVVHPVLISLFKLKRCRQIRKYLQIFVNQITQLKEGNNGTKINNVFF